MDYLFTPWRYAYITTAGKTAGCIFCEIQKGPDDRKALILERAPHCFVMLNAFPYTSGHIMIVPREHLDQLAKLSADTASEMMALMQKYERILRALYHPDGLNMGVNIGAAAGAGVAGHVHMHALPRWVADANFMSTVGETRVVPESLETTWQRLRAEIAKGT